jgi:hypothetical protein
MGDLAAARRSFCLRRPATQPYGSYGEGIGTVVRAWCTRKSTDPDLAASDQFYRGDPVHMGDLAAARRSVCRPRPATPPPRCRKGADVNHRFTNPCQNPSAFMVHATLGIPPTPLVSGGQWIPRVAWTKGRMADKGKDGVKEGKVSKPCHAMAWHAGRGRRPELGSLMQHRTALPQGTHASSGQDEERARRRATQTIAPARAAPVSGPELAAPEARKQVCPEPQQTPPVSCAVTSEHRRPWLRAAARAGTRKSPHHRSDLPRGEGRSAARPEADRPS